MLIATSTSLSPQAVDEVNKWNSQRNRLIVRFWDGANLISKLQQFPELLIKYELTENPSRESAIALLPVIKILLKYSDSTLSAHVFGIDIENKISVIHSLSELITVRMSNIEKYQHVVVQKYIDKKDGNEWLTGGHLVEELGLDTFSFRAVINYIKDVTGENELVISKDDKDLIVNFKNKIHTYAVNDLLDLSMLSNIRIIAKNDSIILQRIDL